MDLSATFNSLGETAESPTKKDTAIATQVAPEPVGESVVVMAGSMDWMRAVKGSAGKISTKKMTPTTDGEEPEQFNVPTVLGGLTTIQSLAVGPSAGHMLMIGKEGEVWVMGLNSSGQLGLGDFDAVVVRAPMVAKLWTEKKKTAVKAVVGKNHSLVLFDDGSLSSAGSGVRGALGRGSRKKSEMLENVPAPGPVNLKSKVTDMAAGCDFSLAVTEDGSLYSWGWTEFGKLGQGTDGSYNTKDASIKMTYTAESDPLRVGFPQNQSPDDPHDHKVVSCSAGKNHAACVCEDGVGYTWGDGAYGKLGHKTQEMLTRPTRLQEARFTILLCGDSSTCGLGYPVYPRRPFTKPANQKDGMLYIWGVLKGTHGEGATHPRAEPELQGWNIKCATLAMGAAHVALHADDAAIAWAQSPVAWGQLGYGTKGPKSSHKPQKLHDLDGIPKCAQVTAHAGATYFLFDKASDTPKVLDNLDVWTPPEGDGAVISSADVGGAADVDDDDGRQKKGGKKGGGGAKKRGASSSTKKPAAKKSKK